MRVLMTGATGLIGRELGKALAAGSPAMSSIEHILDCRSRRIDGHFGARGPGFAPAATGRESPSTSAAVS